MNLKKLATGIVTAAFAIGLSISVNVGSASASSQHFQRSHSQTIERMEDEYILKMTKSKSGEKVQKVQSSKKRHTVYSHQTRWYDGKIIDDEYKDGVLYHSQFRF